MAPTTTDLVQVDRRADGVAVITINNTAAKLNTLNREVVAGLSRAAKDLNADPPGAVVITGREDLLTAGAQVQEFQTDSAGEVTGRFRQAFDAIEAIPRVTIAAVEGYALGAGCELILACDFRVAGKSARIGLPEITLGVFPGGGGTQRLPRLVGIARAKELIYSGRVVRSDEALQIGLLDRVVDDRAALESAVSWAAEFATGAVLAQADCKRLIEASYTAELSRGLDLEQEAWASIHQTEDGQNGILSFFESGPGHAVFQGR